MVAKDALFYICREGLHVGQIDTRGGESRRIHENWIRTNVLTKIEYV